MQKHSDIRTEVFFSCFSAEQVNKPNTVLGDAPWLFSLDERDVKILPENILLEGKKMRTS